MYKSVTDHPLFKKIAPHIRIEEYARDGGHKNPRKRIELKTAFMTPQLIQEVLDMQVQCCACEQPIHPFRPRVKGQGNRTKVARHVYVAVACSNASNGGGCSRGKAAKAEYVRIESTVEELVGT